MGDVIRIEHGGRPWRPTDSGELREVFAEFNVPTAGILAQDGHEYLFWCLLGHNDPTTVWVYALLEDDESKALCELEDATTGFNHMARLLAERPITLAVADERAGIVFAASATIEGAPFDSAREAHACLAEEAYWLIESQLDKLRSEVRSRHQPFGRRHTPLAAAT